MKTHLLLIIGILVLASLSLAQYSPPNYLSVNFTLSGGYTAPSYLSVNLTLGDIVTDTNCTAPTINTNKNVSMQSLCNITSPWNLGTGNLTFYGAYGYFNLSANLNTSNLGKTPANTTLWIRSGYTLRVKAP